MFRGQSRGRIIPSTFFGMTALHLDGLGNYGGQVGYPRTPLSDLGYTRYRLWDNDVTHKAIEPIQGSPDWSRLDDCMSRLQAAGLKPMYTLGQLPGWATGGDGRPGHLRYNNSPPTDNAYVQAFISALINRYGATAFDAFELWNEFDLSNFWTGTEDQMVALAQKASETIRSVAPNAIIVGPSISTGKFAASCSLAGRVANRIVNYVDAFAMHSYNSDYPFDTYRNIDTVRTGLLGLGKPLWVTEFFNAEVDALLPVDDADQAGQVWKVLISNWIGGVDRTYWWQMGHIDVPAQLVDPNNPATVKPAGYAYKRFVDLFTGAALYNRKVSSGLVTVDFALKDGTTGKVMWTSSGTLSVNLSGYTRGEDVLGNGITLSSSYALGVVPVCAYN